MTLQTNPWTAWILLALIVCALLIYQRGRRNDAVQILLTGFFVCGTVGLTICLAMDSVVFDVRRWLIISGLYAGLEIVRWLCYRLVAYIFEIKVRNSTLVTDYFNIWTYVSCACLLLCLGVFAIGQIPGMLVLMAVFFVSEVLWVLYKALRQYLHSAEDLFFVLLSIVTIEVLPIVFFAIYVLRMTDYNFQF